MTTHNETKVANQTEANASAEQGSEDSEWGFSSESSGISRETKIGLALIFILLSAFGFVVFRKMNPTRNQPAGETATAVADENSAKPAADSNPPTGFETPQDNPDGGDSQSGFLAGDDSSGRLDEFGFGDNSRPDNSNSRTAADFGSPQLLDGGEDFAGNTAGNASVHGGISDPSGPFARDASRNTSAGATPTTAAVPPAELAFGLGHEDVPTGFQSDSRDVAASHNDGTRSAAAGTANSHSSNVATDIFGNPIQGADANAANQDRVYVGKVRTDNGFEQPRSQGFDGAPTADSFDGSDAGAANDNRLGGFAPIETRREASSRTAVERPNSEPPRFGAGFTADQPAVIAATDFNTGGDEFDSAGDAPARLERTADGADGFEKPFTKNTQTEPKLTPLLDLGDDVPVRKPVPGISFGGRAGRGAVGVDSNRFESNSFKQPARTAEPAFGAASPIGTHSSQFAATSGAGEYVVQPNENFWSISKKRYGTVRYFQALQELNKSRVPDPTRMRLGTRILLPSPQELEARFPALLPESTRSDQFASATGRRAVGNSRQQSIGFFLSPTGQPMFRVGDDDTLTSISKAYLGRSSRWIQVYNLNRDRVQNPDKLNIGLVLRLPADASQLRLSPTTGAFR